MSFRFHPDAEAELFEAIQYYEDVEPGLGQEFAVEVRRALCGDFRMGFCILKKVRES